MPVNQLKSPKQSFYGQKHKQWGRNRFIQQKNLESKNALFLCSFISFVFFFVSFIESLFIYPSNSTPLTLLQLLLIKLLAMSFQRHSADSTAVMFFTKYSDPSQLTNTERKRFRSTFQASKLGDQGKMNEIQDMFNNYTLFKYGQYASSDKRRHSMKSIPIEKNPIRHKNMKQRTKDNQILKERLDKMKSERQQLFDRLSTITSKNPRKI